MNRDAQRMFDALRAGMASSMSPPAELADDGHADPPAPTRHIWHLGRVVDGTARGAGSVYPETGVYFEEVDRITEATFAGSETHDSAMAYTLSQAADPWVLAEDREDYRPVGALFEFVYDRSVPQYRIMTPPAPLGGGGEFHRTPDATAPDPIEGDLITEAPSMAVRSILTGATTGGANGGNELRLYYRNTRRRANGTWEFEDDAVKIMKITARAYGENVVFTVTQDTEAP